MSGRPTFKTANGYGSYSNIQSRLISGKDQTAHTKLKFRQIGQASVDEVKKKDFKKSLDVKEQKHVLENDKTTAWMAKDLAENPISDSPHLIKYQSELPIVEIAKKYDDADIDENSSVSTSSDREDSFDSSRFVLLNHLVVIMLRWCLFSVTAQMKRMMKRMMKKRNYRQNWKGFVKSGLHHKQRNCLKKKKYQKNLSEKMR